MIKSCNICYNHHLHFVQRVTGVVAVASDRGRANVKVAGYRGNCFKTTDVLISAARKRLATMESA